MKNFMRIGVAVALLTASSISPTLAQTASTGTTGAPLPAGGAAGSDTAGMSSGTIAVGVAAAVAVGIAAAIASSHDDSAPAAASTSTSTSTTGTP